MRPELKVVTGTLRDAVAVFLLDHITETYANWRSGPEPSLTIGTLKNWLDEIEATPRSYRYATSSVRYRTVGVSLKKLVEDGKIAFREGMGLKGSKARCFSPIGREGLDRATPDR